MKILITGASGHLGSKIIENLVNQLPASSIIAGMRDTHSEEAEAFAAQDIEVRETDFEKKETLVEAFQGVDRVFIVSTLVDPEGLIRQQTNVNEAAKEAGIDLMVYSSAPYADVSEFFLATDHRTREEMIKESGIPYVFTRNNWYVSNELGTVQQSLDGAPWVTSAGEGKVGWVYRPDLAEATANILAGEDYENKAYELTGENLTQRQFVDALNEVTGKNIQVVAVDETTHREMLEEANLPEEAITITLKLQKAIRKGHLESGHSDLEMLLGRKATSVKEALQKLLNQ